MMTAVPALNRIPLSEVPLWLFLAVLALVLGPVLWRRLRRKDNQRSGE